MSLFSQLPLRRLNAMKFYNATFSTVVSRFRSDNEVKWAAARSQYGKGIEISYVLYKLYEGAECAFPQAHWAILSLALFVLIMSHHNFCTVCGWCRLYLYVAGAGYIADIVYAS